MIIQNQDSPYPFICIEQDTNLTQIVVALTELRARPAVRSIAIQIDKTFITEHIKEVFQQFNFSLLEEETEIKVTRDLSGIISANISSLSWIQFKTFNEAGLQPFLEVAQGISSVRRLKTEEGMLYLQREYFNPNVWLVGFCEQKAICMILGQVQNNKGTCLYLGLIDSYHGKGLGQALFEKALELLRANGARTYFDSTSKKNTPMKRIFEKAGCRVQAELLTYISGDAP